MAKAKPLESGEGEVERPDLLPPQAEEASASAAAPAASAKPKGPARASKPKGDQLIVRVPGNVPQGPPGGHHRVFSKDEHGDDFADSAEQYRKRYNGEYVDALPAAKVCPSCKRAL